ncbi:MAG TPA: hypothetical protein VF691_23015 [Cytophagaceae bacterium]|jgi:hypothetical protein
MKTYLQIFFLVLAFNYSINQVKAQSGIIDGTKWYYGTKNWAWGGGESYFTLEATHDTVFAGKTWKILQYGPDSDLQRNNEYVYIENGKAYSSNNKGTTTVNVVNLLFDVNKKQGESWEIYRAQRFQWEGLEIDPKVDTIIVQVDSVGLTTVNSTELKTLFVTYRSVKKTSPFQNMKSRIIDRIGDVNHLFYFRYFNGGYDQPAVSLRCYNEPGFGNYSTGVAPSCDYRSDRTTPTTKSENSSLKDLVIFPTVAEDKLNVIFSKDEKLLYRIIDISGKTIKGGVVVSGGAITTQELQKGILLIEFYSEKENIKTTKKIFLK